jgi:DNA-binding transcriptional LysR family regulator
MSMNIDLRWLQSFLAAAEELNFSRAARRLHLAQPALTAHIRQLEEAVGTRLFVRSNRIHGLTPAGKALQGEAQAVVGRAQGLKQIAMRARNGETGTLRLGIIPPAAVSPIASVLREFSRKFPLVTLSVCQNDQQRLVQMLLDKDLDLVLGRSCSGRKLSGCVSVACSSRSRGSFCVKTTLWLNMAAFQSQSSRARRSCCCTTILISAEILWNWLLVNV